MQTQAAQAGFQPGVRFLDDKFFCAWNFVKPMEVEGRPSRVEGAGGRAK
jgi:hypothetical protein